MGHDDTGKQASWSANKWTWKKKMLREKASKKCFKETLDM